MNRVILMGRLTRDPELRQTPQGTSVTQFSVAVPRRMSKSGETDFINCIAWRQTAEFIAQYFYKGKMIALEGSIQTRSWDGQDGKKHYATEVVADAVYFCEKEQRTDPNTGYQTMPSCDEPARPKQEKINFNDLDGQFGGFEDLDEEATEDDLPF